MRTILDLLRNDPNLSPTFKAAITPVWFRANCGRHRAFLSQADADAYERGFLNYPDTPDMLVAMHTPEWDGYFDAEERVVERDDMVEKEAREARERGE
jgi:hypothetical protein